MDAHDAARELVARSGLTHRQIETMQGKSSGYVGQILARPRPGADTIAELARACGYRLQLVPIADDRATITIGDDTAPEHTSHSIADVRRMLVQAAAMLDSLDE